MEIKSKVMARGEMCVDIIGRNGEVRTSTGWVSNLILNRGLEQRLEFSISSAVSYKTYEDTTPNKVLLDGTFSQSGTTITRVSGSGDLTQHNVADTIKFADGTRALITSITSASECQVYEDQTVSAAAISVYRTSPTSAPAGFKQQGNTIINLENSADDSTGIKVDDYQCEFPASPTDYTLASVWVSSYARVVLPVPINVLTGEQPRIRYRYMRTLDNSSAINFPSIGVIGWPHRVPASTIVGTASEITLTLSEDHYFEVGDEVEIHDAKPSGSEVTSITSDGTDWTVTTSTSHGLSVSDSVLIEDCNIPGYNGTYTVATAPTSTTLTITNATNLTSAISGVTRPATPSPYFNGFHTVSSVPDLRTVVINTPMDVLAADTGSISTKDTSCTISTYGENWAATIYHPMGYVILSDTKLVDPAPTMGDSTGINGTIRGQASSSSNTVETPSAQNNFTFMIHLGVSTAVAKRRIKQIITINSYYGPWRGFVVDFDHVQTKADGYNLTLSMTFKLEQELA